MSLHTLEWVYTAWQLVFVFALGATLGSFINVLVWRLPAGLSPLSPPSACPVCGTRIWWRDNIPIFGWLLLRGRCRFCKARISPEYPLVELFVATLFTGLYALWIADPSPLALTGVDLELWRPAWTGAGVMRTWPTLILTGIMFGALIAASLIDARTFTIPLLLIWIPAAIALAVHPVHAAIVGSLDRTEVLWSMPLLGPDLVAAAALGFAGLCISWILWWFGLMPRSFADYEHWEKQARAAREEMEGEGEPADEGDIALREALLRVGVLLVPAGVLGAIAWPLAPDESMAPAAMGIGGICGLAIGMIIRGFIIAPGRETSSTSGDPVWLSYPHARREMFKEMLFLAPPAIGITLGILLAAPGSHSESLAADLPLWADVLASSLMGLLAGGGLLWLIRIGGTFAFGKEAMGLGDVHLMAAVGVVFGPIAATAPLLIAPALGLAWFLASAVFAAARGRSASALPFGPHLAAGCIVVVIVWPVLERWMAGPPA